MNENPFENPFTNSSNENRSIKPGMSGCRLVVLIALGILLASFIGCVASFAFTGAILKGVGDALKQEQHVVAPVNPIYNEKGKFYTAKNNQQVTTIQSADLITKALINPAINETNQIIEQMGKDLIINQPTYRKEIIRKKSEEAVLRTRTETQSFNAIYKKPEECLNIKDNKTRVNCANHYMRARVAFEGN